MEMTYLQMSAEQLNSEKALLMAQYDEIKAKGLSLDLSRGKPSRAQLDLVDDMLTCLKSSEDCIAENGFDCRNYGVLDGMPETKRLFSELLGISDRIIVMSGGRLSGEVTVPSEREKLDGKKIQEEIMSLATKYV